MRIWRTLFCIVYLLLVLLLECVWSRNCVKTSTCSCEFDDDNGIINLEGLGNDDNTARFAGEELDDGNLYYYNPCHPFNEGSCNDAAVCVNKSGQLIKIGDADRVTFVYDDGNKDVAVAYASGTAEITITTVQLVCNESTTTPELSGLGHISDTAYALTVTTECACPNQCSANRPPAPTKSSVELSPGSILLIIFFSILVAYLLVGSAFMKIGRKAEGKNIIPNIIFWQTVQSLIQEGFVFTISVVCRRKQGYHET